jgi:hypothetical protein
MWPIGRYEPGGQIVSPEHVDQFRTRIERHHFLTLVTDPKTGLDPIDHAGLGVLAGNLIQRRQLSRDIFLDHGATSRHAIGELQQQHLPVRQARIGNGAHQYPMVGRCNCQHLRNERVGALGIGAQHAGDKADIGAGRFCVLESLQVAETVHEHRKGVGLGLAAIGIDPSQHRVGRIGRRIRRLLLRSGRRGKEEGKCNEGREPFGRVPPKSQCSDKQVTCEQLSGSHGPLRLSGRERPWTPVGAATYS